MYMIGTTIVGILLGVSGSEILRRRCPDLVKRVEDSAKRVVDSFSLSGSPPQENEEDAG